MRITELPEMLRSHVIDEIIFATDSRRLAELEDVMLLCEEEGVRTRIARGFSAAREQPRVSGPAGNALRC